MYRTTVEGPRLEDTWKDHPPDTLVSASPPVDSRRHGTFPHLPLAARYTPPHLRSKGLAAYPPPLQLSSPCVPSCISPAWCTDNGDMSNFHFGEKPFGISTTVGGKGLVAETELKGKADVDEPTVSAEVKFNASMDSVAGKADVDATATAAEAADAPDTQVSTSPPVDSRRHGTFPHPYLLIRAQIAREMFLVAETELNGKADVDEPTVSAKVKLKAEADAIKAIEANSVAEKAIAAAKANAALTAMAVTVDDLKATATLSVKVDTTTAEVKFNASMDSVVGKADADATAIAAEAADGGKLTASTEVKLKAEADAINELASSAFLKAEVKKSESPPTTITKGLEVPNEIRDISLSTLKNHPHPRRVALPEVSNHRTYPHEGRKFLLIGDITEGTISHHKFNC